MSSFWVWVEQFEGQPASVSWEALGLARRLADEVGGSVTAVMLGPNAEALASAAIARGADAALINQEAVFADFRIDPYVSTLAALAEEHSPTAIFAGATTRGTDVLGALSVDLDTALITDATEVSLTADGLLGHRPAYSGKVMATVRSHGPIHLVTLRNRAFPAPTPDDGRSGEVTTITPAKTEDDIPEKTQGFEVTSGEVSLTDAAIIVAGGRGVGSPEGFDPIRSLADALGGAVGASRAVVDAGWIPYEHQVGQTGKTVSPDLYIAAGISGAVQHQAGMRTSKVIVAINKDPDAPIFKLAHYGIVGDLFDYVPALTAEFEDRLS
jgi:electron transfer flavoprotein alpha subunit